MKIVEDEHERPRSSERLAEQPEEPCDLRRGRRRLGLEGGDDCVTLCGRRRVPQDLAQRPVRDAVAVRETAARERRDGLGSADELRSEPRLADSRGSDDAGDARRPLVHRALQRFAEPRELVLPADERCVQPPLERRRDRRQLDKAVRAHRLPPALDRELAQRVELRGVVDQPARELPDHDLAGRGALLEPRGDADGFARDQPLS